MVSFIHAFFVHEHFFHERRVPGPSLGGLGPARGRVHNRFCHGGTPSPARRPTRQKPSPAESGCGGKDTGFARSAVSGSSNRAGRPNCRHQAGEDPSVWGWRRACGEQAGRRSLEAPGPQGRMGSALEAYGQRRFRGLRGALLGLGGDQGRPAGEGGGWRAQRPPYGKCAAELCPLERAWGGHCAPGARAPGEWVRGPVSEPPPQPALRGAWRGSGEGGLVALSPALRRWQQVSGYLPASGAAGAAGAGQ